MTRKRTPPLPHEVLAKLIDASVSEERAVLGLMRREELAGRSGGDLHRLFQRIERLRSDMESLLHAAHHEALARESKS